MNLLKELNNQEMELLKNAGVQLTDKEYASEELKKIETSVEEFIMIHSENEIGRVGSKYSGILNKIISAE